MPSFGDIMDAVDMLAVDAVNIDVLTCVRTTNRNSKCTKCADACIADAITLSRGQVDIDNTACINCGCCVPVCPVCALSMVEPSVQTVVKRTAKVADFHTRSMAFACSRIASKNLVDTDRFAEVPCLGHISEIQLMELAACGIDDILLVDGNCKTCKLGKASSRIDDVVDVCANLFDACECSAIITRHSSFPDEYISSGINVRGEGRRGLLKQTTSYVKTVAGNVAKKTIEEKLSEAGVKSSRESSTFKQGKGVVHLKPDVNYAIIEAMEKLGSEKGALGENEEAAYSLDTCAHKISTRHFGNVYIDVEKCSGCGMCVMFCPTNALKYDQFDQPENDDARYCDFQASDCLQCMLCKDVCLRECLEVSQEVTFEELLDFEPRLLQISKPKKATGLAGLARYNH